MDYTRILPVLFWVVMTCLQTGIAVPQLSIRWRLKRANPNRNALEPPIPNFPSKEDAPAFWIPPPYPLPTTESPPPRQPIQRTSRYLDSINPYLDVLTDSFYPNYGFGVLFQQPVLISGGLNWPTGNILQPTDKFNGTLGFVRPVELRFGTQGGPFYPWQDRRFPQTIRDIDEANLIAQRGQVETLRALGQQVQSDPFVISDPALKRTQLRFDHQPLGSGRHWNQFLLPRFK